MTQIFLVLLRLAIGWHFLYEGYYKWQSYRPTEHPAGRWSAEGYLRAASGPLAPHYWRLLDDPDGIAVLNDPSGDTLAQKWEEYVKRFGGFYGFEEKQFTDAKAKLDQKKQEASDWLKANERFITDYIRAAETLRAKETQKLARFERQRLYDDQLKGLAAQRSWLMGKVNGWTADLQDSLVALLTNEQRAKAPVSATYPLDPDWSEWSKLDWVNRLTIYGLMAMGLCLLLGLFTRLASLGAFVFLMSLYFAMPPLPGYPGTATGGGHYLLVNPHLIEALAVLAVSGSGRWAGIDALIHRLLFGKPKPAVERLGVRPVGQVIQARR